MVEVSVRDTCGSPIGKTPSSRFCQEKMRFCHETPTVRHRPNGLTQVSVCMFETKDEILDTVRERLTAEERSEFERIWVDDSFSRTFERQGDCLLIRGDFQQAICEGAIRSQAIR